MPSTPTARIRANKQASGDNVDAWAGILNGALDTIDEAFGFAEIAVNGTKTLTVVNFAADEARRSVLRFVGSGGTVIVPAVEKFYLIDNQCSGDVALKTAATAGASIVAGSKSFVYCDATKVVGGISSTSSAAQNVSVSASPSIMATNVQAALIELLGNINNRVRVDTPQSLSSAQQTQALQNLGKPYIVSSASGSFNYRVWSDGYIEQWGLTATVTGSDPAILFPISFPTACDGVLGTVQTGPGTTTFHGVSATGGLSGATFFPRFAVNGGSVGQLPSGFNIAWRAVGR